MSQARMLPDELERILLTTPELAHSYLVGGGVRDWLLGQPTKDYDVEVFGLDYERLVRALSRWGQPDLVGRSFGVVKLTTASGAAYDFSLPRRDSKVGPGHRAFDVVVEPGLTPREAAARRDFTINALMYDPRRREVLDFFDGRGDLSRRLLRHTSPAFVEDPLRVLRGLQFAGRFNLTATAETIALCRQIKRSHAELAVERRREEWFKWAGKSVAPSAGLRYLAATEWVEHYPEIQALMGTPQDPDWHPEGDVFVHTCLCCDALAEMPEFQAGDAEAKVVYMLAVLAHDFAKPQTTQRALKDGRLRIVSPGHDRAGVGLAEQFLARIDAPAAIRLRVLPLVAYHLAHFQDLTDRSVRRLARNLAPETIEGLCLVITADAFGRPPKPREMPEAVVQLRAKAAQLRVQASPPKPLLLGRHLIEAGLAPGPGFGPILRAAFEAQLEGEFVDLPGALAWLERRLGQAKAAQRSE